MGARGRAGRELARAGAGQATRRGDLLSGRSRVAEADAEEYWNKTEQQRE